jgi:hypothetical protein
MNTRMPGFNADASLGASARQYRHNATSGGPSAQIGSGVVPQFRSNISSDPDIGSYLRCRANGGSDLICRFFGGLPPFTIGGLLF